MATKLSKTKKTIITAASAVVVLLALLYINMFVYPFVATKPNFSDVEETYSKITIPTDWKLIEEDENKGIAGRQCPIESDGCFSIQKLFALPANTTKDTVRTVVLSSGCVSVIDNDKTQIGDSRARFSYTCSGVYSEVIGVWQDDGDSLTGRITILSR